MPPPLDINLTSTFFNGPDHRLAWMLNSNSLPDLPQMIEVVLKIPPKYSSVTLHGFNHVADTDNQ